MAKFYLTTAIPYVNAKPHVGHTLEFVQADVIARYHKILGDDVLLLSGGDENAIKNVQAAEKEGTLIQEFVDKNSQLFLDIAKKLNVNFDIFQKGSNKDHYKSSQGLWNLCFKNGDIYKKEYSGLYCVGCELFYEKDELDKNGECYEHPGKKLEEVTEENYFFKLSKYQDQIEKLLASDEIKIIPENRKKEALMFVRQGLKDISISRSNTRARNWGVPVPNDSTQRMYVWFDALNIYQSGIGFGWNEEKYNKWWPADLHVIGKGILRFHAIYWPAFLLSAGLKLPKSIFVHGYFTVNGQKMSKTVGNVIDPVEIIEKYGIDAFRYYLLREIPSTADGDFSEKRLKDVYNADLANGLGNLVSRVAKLCETSGFSFEIKVKNEISKPVKDALDQYRFDEALKRIWENITKANQTINETKPWELKGEELKNNLSILIENITRIAFDLKPFLPETPEKIQEQFQCPKIKSEKPLFPRLK
ncbi:MAG: methionine--tRNA ligase [Candidatus Levybacteria bacterium]|nr:methionine--tRNA ligase [Candidatus Levybacteria bacterium]